MRAMILVLLLATAAHAQPFLVCDPPTDEVHHYEIMGLGETIIAQPDPTGEHGFKHDLLGLDIGNYTVTAKACSMWECSDDSVPLGFKRPSKPASPSGVDIMFTSGGGD